MIRYGILLVCFVLLGAPVFGQLEWEARASMPNNGRSAFVSMELNGKIYCGLGTANGSTPYLNDWWEYNPQTDIWTRKADFPGTGLFAPAHFAVDNKGYVFMGNTNSGTLSSACYSYNPTTDSWTNLGSFPGSPRYSAGSFVIGDTAFIACGSGGGPTSYKNDLWMYVPATNSWTQKANLPGGVRNNVTAFALDQFGYVGAGNGASAATYNSFWKYNKATNSWSSIANMPQARTVATHFTLNGFAYVGLGKNASGSPYYPGFYQYNPSSNTWSSSISNSTNITLRAATNAVTISDSVYLLLGEMSSLFHTGIFQLKTNDTCDYFDTTFVQDTVFINDTTFVQDTVFINDTTFYAAYDTSYVTLYDTITTTTYDTTTVYIIDTLYQTINDTIYIAIYDTITTVVYDTVTTYSYDTIIRYINIVVEDTLNFTVYTDDCGDVIHKIYPNPTADWVYVYSNNVDCYPNYNVELITSLGQVLQLKKYESLVSFNMRGYAVGLYFIRLRGGSGDVVFSKKVMIN